MVNMKTDDEFRSRLQSLVQGSRLQVFAANCGVSHAMASHYLKGTRPGMDVLVAMARSYKVSLNWLCLGLGPKDLDEAVLPREKVSWDAILRDDDDSVEDPAVSLNEEEESLSDDLPVNGGFGKAVSELETEVDLCRKVAQAIFGYPADSQSVFTLYAMVREKLDK